MIPLILKKIVNFKVAITEMHPHISWELFADPVGSVEHTLGTTGLEVPFFQRRSMAVSVITYSLM